MTGDRRDYARLGGHPPLPLRHQDREAILVAEIRRLRQSRQELVDHAVAAVVAGNPKDRWPAKGHYVYILWGKDPDRPLYVGQSKNIMARLGSHAWDKGHLIQSVQLIRAGNQAMRMEARLIRSMRPTLNRGVPAS